mgnify:CR=1 FL=1
MPISTTVSPRLSVVILRTRAGLPCPMLCETIVEVPVLSPKPRLITARVTGKVKLIAASSRTPSIPM